MRLSSRLRLLGAQRAPTALVLRITYALDSEAQGAGRRPATRSIWLRWGRRPLVAALTSVAVGAVVLGVLSSDSVPTPQEPNVQFSTALRMPQVAGLRSSDSRHVSDWIAAKLGYELTVPEILGAELIGARLLRSGDETIAAADYRMHGKILSYLVLSTPSIFGPPIAGDSVLQYSDGHHNLAAWSENGRTLAVVSQLPENDVAAVALECKRTTAAL